MRKELVVGILVAAGLLAVSLVPGARAETPAAGTCKQWMVMTKGAKDLKQAPGKDWTMLMAPEGWEPLTSYQNISSGNVQYVFRRCAE